MKDNNELKHSIIYLGADFSDGIKHWKYIKKYKLPSGHYRYIYQSEVNNKLKQNLGYSPEELRKMEKDPTEWIEVGTSKTAKGTKIYEYVSADGKVTRSTPTRMKTEKPSMFKKQIALAKNWLYRTF